MGQKCLRGPKKNSADTQYAKVQQEQKLDVSVFPLPKEILERGEYKTDLSDVNNEQNAELMRINREKKRKHNEYLRDIEDGFLFSDQFSESDSSLLDDCKHNRKYKKEVSYSSSEFEVYSEIEIKSYSSLNITNTKSESPRYLAYKKNKKLYKGIKRKNRRKIFGKHNVSNSDHDHDNLNENGRNIPISEYNLNENGIRRTTRCKLTNDRMINNSNSISIRPNYVIPELDEIDGFNISSLPNLPITFVENRLIWNHELILYTKTLSDIAYHKLNKNDNTKRIETFILNEPEQIILSLILEYALIDVLYKYKCNKTNQGLWLQHYIVNESLKENGLNAKSMIISSIRDQLIHSFNLKSIFQICGSTFLSSMPMNNFFVYGVDINQATNSNIGTPFPPVPLDQHIDAQSGYYSNNSMYNTSDIDNGYISNTTTCFDNINPLKFKIYEHDIMVCNTGCYIEKHNEFYEEDTDDDDADDADTVDPSYFFTLLLLPPNKSSYKGGKFIFHGVGNTDNTLISADCTSWKWIAFDKRVKYETEPVINGTSIVFKMDIDVWKKSEKEIKKVEESQSRLKKIQNGELLLNSINQNTSLHSVEIKTKRAIEYSQCNQNNNDNNKMERAVSHSNSSVSPSPSANICFCPYPVNMEPIILETQTK